MNFDRLLQLYRGIKGFAARHRLPLMLLALALFFGGLAWSISAIEIAWADVQAWPLLLTLLLLVPLTVLVSAWNLQLLARLVERRINLETAIMATAYGRIAEVLPIPGAVIVRGMALMQSGASAGETAKVMAWSGLLTLAMAGMVASLPLLAYFAGVAAIVLLASTILAGICLVWLVRQLDATVAIQMVGIRLAMLALSVLRFFACFAALSYAAPLLDTAIFVIGGTLTTLIGIVPAGLGIAEMVSAALALSVGIPAAIAFLAAALNRVTGLAGSGLIAAACWLLRGKNIGGDA